MMKKLERMAEYPSAPLKMVLAPDWDVLQAVFNELKWFPEKPSIDWLQSHQDDNPNIVQSIPVQLNVCADELATEGLNRLPPKPHVPLDPSAKIQLNYRGKTVTRNIPQFLRENLLLPSLRKQYVKRFDWHLNEFDDIDWAIFRPVYKKWVKKKIKWTHQYSTRNLPCGERLRKHGSDDPIDCKSCGCHLETDDHLFQCPRRPQFLRRIQSIIDEMRDKLDPCLYHLLKTHLTAYISGDDILLTTVQTLNHKRSVSRSNRN